MPPCQDEPSASGSTFLLAYLSSYDINLEQNAEQIFIQMMILKKCIMQLNGCKY